MSTRYVTHTHSVSSAFDHGCFAQASEFPDTVYGNVTAETRLQSETADSILWQSFTSPSSVSALSPAVRSALTRVEFVDLASPAPLRDVLARIEGETDMAVRQKAARPFVVVGRARRLAAESHHAELGKIFHGRAEGHVRSEVRKTMGDVATAVVVSGSIAGLLVVQAALTSVGG